METPCRYTFHESCSCALIIEKTNFEDIRNRISSDTNLTQNSSDDISNCFTELKHFRLNNSKNLILGHLNINSLRNKFETVKNIIEDTFDIFLISETKIDNSFPNSEFSINGYRMFRRDSNCFGGGLCLYVKDRIASKQLNSHKENTNTEAIYLEINIRKRKWLIIGTYKPPSQNNSLFLENLPNNLSTYLKGYDNILLQGDFNMTPENTNLQHFTDSSNLENLIHEAACSTGLPSCIDLIITYRKPYFKNTCVTTTGMSDFHKLIAVSLKSQVLKAPAKRKFYRNYKNFDGDNFNRHLKLKLDSLKELGYSLFKNTFIDVLNTHAPIRTKTLRANSHQFMTKALQKAIMTRSSLKNIYLKSRNEEN